MWKSAGLRVLSLVQLKYILSPILISVTQISVWFELRSYLRRSLFASGKDTTGSV